MGAKQSDYKAHEMNIVGACIHYFEVWARQGNDAIVLFWNVSRFERINSNLML